MRQGSGGAGTDHRLVKTTPKPRATKKRRGFELDSLLGVGEVVAAGAEVTKLAGEEMVALMMIARNGP